MELGMRVADGAASALPTAPSVLAETAAAGNAQDPPSEAAIVVHRFQASRSAA